MAGWSKRSTRSAGCTTREIRRIVGHLKDAQKFAPEPFARALAALVRFYETGEDTEREAFDIAWVQNRETTVDTMNGFIEVYMDARGMKGAWEGLVYYVNHEKTDKIRALATHAQWFEDNLPVRPEHRKPKVQGVSAMAIEVVDRGRRVGSDHADWREPAERSAHPRKLRQQVGVAVERARCLREIDARHLSPRVRVGFRRRSSGPSGGARLPAS